MTDTDYEKYFNDPEHRKKGMKKKKKKNIKKNKVLFISGGVFVLILAVFIAFIYSGLPSLEELENLVTALENMSQVADKSAMREQILKTVKKVKQEIAKRLKNL